jgi:serine protease Do
MHAIPTRALAITALVAALAAAEPSLAAADAAATSVVARLSDDLQALAERVRPSVVQVLVTGYAPGGASGPLLAKQRGGGSGVVLTADGYIITNLHVIDGARRIDVVVPPPAPAPGRSVIKGVGRTLWATVVGVDRETDLALLHVPEKGLSAIELGDSEAVKPGQLVVAFGTPLGLEGSVSMGVVSAVARQLEPESPMIYLQTDASINPGNSGGPLVDVAGRVVGINTLIYSQSGGSEGIGFAAPSNIVRHVYEEIRHAGRVRRGDIGAHVQTVTPELAAGLALPRDLGVIVGDVTPGGPAAAAGLQTGDLVLALDGKPMENARQLSVNLYQRSVGTTGVLEVLRGTTPMTVAVTILERPRDPERLAELVSQERNLVPALGVLALDLSDLRLAGMLQPLRGRIGVLVAAASSDRLPRQDGLQAGDAIYSLDGKPIAGLEGLRAAAEAARGKHTVVLQIEREGVLRYVVVPLD